MNEVQRFRQLCEFVQRNVADFWRYLQLPDEEKLEEIFRLAPDLIFDMLSAEQLEAKGIADGEGLIEYLDQQGFKASDWPEVSLEKVSHVLLTQYPPDEAPSWMHMHFTGLVKNQWLVHFTDHADKILANGFEVGTPAWNMERLGLTTWFSESSKSGGYNFAFLPGDSVRPEHGFDGQRTYYGNQVIMFRASGVRVYHWGDQQYQVIFWGETARDLVYCGSVRSGWQIEDRETGRRLVGGEGTGAKDLAKVIAWVRQNYQQYRDRIGYRTAGG